MRHSFIGFRLRRELYGWSKKVTDTLRVEFHKKKLDHDHAYWQVVRDDTRSVLGNFKTLASAIAEMRGKISSLKEVK